MALSACTRSTPATLSSSLATTYSQTWITLPATVLARAPPHFTKSELLAVLDFKLTFGQNRPALRAMLAVLSDDAVELATRNALAALPGADSSESKLKAAFRPLLALRGIGPATASLVLNLVHPDVPFFSDEAAVRVLAPPGGRKGLKYTEKEYWRFWARAGELKAEGETMRDWERRVWEEDWDGSKAETKVKVKAKAENPPAGRKRKLEAHETDDPDDQGITLRQEDDTAGRDQPRRSARKSKKARV